VLCFTLVVGGEVVMGNRESEFKHKERVNTPEQPRFTYLSSERRELILVYLEKEKINSFMIRAEESFARGTKYNTDDLNREPQQRSASAKYRDKIKRWLYGDGADENDQEYYKQVLDAEIQVQGEAQEEYRVDTVEAVLLKNMKPLYKKLRKYSWVESPPAEDVEHAFEALELLEIIDSKETTKYNEIGVFLPIWHKRHREVQNVISSNNTDSCC
jgi:hypothetical protein